MSVIYTLCPTQHPEPSHDRLYFSYLQWDALVDVVDIYSENLLKANPDLINKPSLHALYEMIYDDWFLLPGGYVFNHEVMQGYFEVVDLLLDDPDELTQIAATIDSWPLEKLAVDNHGAPYPITVYTADLFTADVEKLRRFFTKHTNFFFA